jgi:hypothetical protein
MSYIEFIATELIVHIFDSLDTVQDVVNLASTCHRLNSIYTSSPQLRFLTNAAERQYGPLGDATQLLTQNSSQPAHLVRSVNTSLALLQQIVHVGSVANKWVEIYPLKKWKEDYINRRSLTDDESYRVRRAIYRIWLFSSAFHSPSYSRETRLLPERVSERTELLRNWPTEQLAEIADVRNIIRTTLSSNVCPSNGTITRKFRARHGDEAVKHLVFNLTNIHLNFPPPQLTDRIACVPPSYTSGHFAAPPPNSIFHESNTYSSTSTTRTKAYHLGRVRGSDAGGEGWGDSIGHYYVVEDLMKLNPDEILRLKEKNMCKSDVLEWIHGRGECFRNNGDTFGETLDVVLDERDVTSEEFDEEDGVVGSSEDEDEEE